MEYASAHVTVLKMALPVSGMFRLILHFFFRYLLSLGSQMQLLFTLRQWAPAEALAEGVHRVSGVEEFLKHVAKDVLLVITSRFDSVKNNTSTILIPSLI